MDPKVLLFSTVRMWWEIDANVEDIKALDIWHSCEINIWNLSYVKAKSLKLVASQYFYALISNIFQISLSY